MLSLQSEVNEPILFRTTTDTVAKATVERGSIWLRSDQFYRELEDTARNDTSEGINTAQLGVPLRIVTPNGPAINIEGTGTIGQQIVPHYIMSLHGSSIATRQRQEFGGNTIGIKSLSRLSAEILYRCSLQLRCTGYRYGAVFYQNAALGLMNFQVGSSAIKLADNPPIYLNPVGTDVLRKSPTLPFIEQDEWRIVIFATGYLSEDPQLPLRIEVNPDHFYYYDKLPFVT